MKILLTLLLVVLIAVGGTLLLAHHDTVARAAIANEKYAPVTASFSRFRGDSAHLVSIYWRLHYASKTPATVHQVAYWSLRPFRHVTLAR